MVHISREAHEQMVAHAVAQYPLEACGLLAGPPGGEGAEVVRFYPCRNLAGSARVYTIDPHDHLLAERDAEAAGLEIVGVMHSHTHTQPYPSPTDVAEAPDPEWHYVIVSLREETAETRSFRIDTSAGMEEAVSEEHVELV